jgi:DNA-binding MurR/RpiR family transcriptional regulator
MAFQEGHPMTVRPSFLARVRDALPQLHPAERKLGQLVCDFPGEVASYSAKELAALAGVSNATVTRFVRRIGYESYEAARREARLESETGSRLYLMPQDNAPIAEALARQLDQSLDNLRRTLVETDPSGVDAAAAAMLGARKIWVIGFRVSHAFAEYLTWQLTQVVEEIVAIPSGGQTLGEHLVSVRTEDCVVLFGLRRRIAGTERILSEIERRGPKLIFVTDEGVPLRTKADWHFRCRTTAAGPLFDHVAVLGLCQALIARVIDRADAEGRARLRRIEALNDALEEL